MKLIYCTGCTCDSLTVDGIEEVDLNTDEKRKGILNKIGDYVSNLELDPKKERQEEQLNVIKRCIYYAKCDEWDEDIVDFGNKTLEDLGNIIKEMSPVELNPLLCEFVPALGKLTYKSSKPCECCGDWITEYTLNI